MRGLFAALCVFAVAHSVLARPDRTRHGGCPAVDPIDRTIHLPHPTDCTKFLRCDHGIAKEDNCPAGLHFNPVLEVCDWPEQAGCTAGSQPEETPTTPETTLPTECPFPDPIDHTVHLPHPTNCTLFYRCDHGQPKLEFCPDNLHFNPVLQVCDWPDSAGCEAEGVTSPPTEATPKPTAAPTTEAPDNTLPTGCPFPDPMDHTVHLPHPTNCSLFYRCDHGQPKLDYCPDGLHFNPSLQVCDWPESAGCEAGGVTSPPTEATPGPTDAPTTPKPTAAPTTPAPGTTEAPDNTLPTGCPFPDPMDHTVHLPHPTNCSLFYRCDHGQPKLDYCPDGLHFNPSLQVCDWPESAGCEAGGVTSPPTEATPGPTDAPTTPKPTAAPTTPAPGTTEAPDNTLPTGCPFPDPMDHTVHLPHPTNCSLFYRCDHGQPKLDYCPDGLHFNPVLQVCDWPESAGCEAGGVTSPPTEATPKPTFVPTTPNPTVAPTTPAAPTTEAPDNTLPNGCPFPDPMDHTVHLPHPTNCSLFYRCDHGQPKLDYCPDGLHFNPSLQVCDWPESAGCEAGGVTSPPTEATPGPTDAPTTPKPTAAPTTPAPGTTEAPDNTLPTGCPFPDPMDHTVHLPHPTNCSLFYRCDHGQPKLDYCPDGLHFNPVLQVCDWPESAGCEAGGVTSPPTEATPGPTDAPTTSKPTAATTTPAPGTTEAPDNTLPTGCPFPDPMDHTVHLPHPTNCSLFYRCDHGQPKLDYCPDGLHFNPSLQVCDWPESAGCEAGGVTSPPTEATPKPTFVPTTPNPTVAPTTPAPGTTEAPDNTLPTGCPFPDPMDHTVHLPHPTNCSLFYRCDHGQPKLDYCPDGLHFNPVLQVCDWPESAGCEAGGVTSPPTEATPGPTDAPTTPKPTAAPTTPAPGTTEAPDNTLPTGCPFPDPMDHTVHLPHPTNCSLFYRCDHGQPKLDYCPDGLHFNPSLQVCDWPESAGCEAGGVTSPPTEATPKPTFVPTTPNPTVAPTTPAPGTTEAPDNTLPTGCPFPDPMDHTVHLPHPTNCSLFYRCDHGQPKLDYCPDGLHFNPSLQVCDWPESAGCEAGGVTSPPTEATPKPTFVPTTPNPTVAPTTPAPGTTEAPDNTLPTGCPFPDPMDHTVHLPHPTNCSLFYRCDHGQPKLDYCPDGLHFNPSLQVCDWPESAGCEAGGVTSPPTEATPKPTFVPTTPNPTVAPTTPAPGTTEAPDNTLPTGCPFPDPMDHTVHLPHPTNCSLFYRCDHGQPKLDYCPDGLHFNPSLQVCDWPEFAGCEAGGVTFPPTEATPNTGGTMSPKPTAEPTTPVAPTTEAPDNTLPTGCPFPDPMDHTVHLPHPTNCSLFYRCDHGQPKLDYCPDGLHFNPSLQVCDWPEFAGCEAGGVTSPPTEATPTPTAEPTTPAAPTTEAPDNTLPEGCPFPDPMDHTVHLPHPTNCSLFYRCDHGQPKLDYCPDGLHFNPSLQVCDWPEFAGCEAGGVTSPPTEATPTPTAEPTTPAVPTTEAPDNTLPEGCPFPDPMDHTVHLPHPTNCSLFYRCDHGQPKLDYCPDGLHFNPSLQVCDWPESAGCEAGGVTPIPTIPAPTTPVPTTLAPTTPAPTTPAPTTSPAPTTTEGTPDGCEGFNDNIVQLPHPDNCSLYLTCVNNEIITQQCPEGQNFDSVLLECDWACHAACLNGTPTTEDPTSGEGSDSSSSSSSESNESSEEIIRV